LLELRLLLLLLGRTCQIVLTTGMMMWVLWYSSLVSPWPTCVYHSSWWMMIRMMIHQWRIIHFSCNIYRKNWSVLLKQLPMLIIRHEILT
jgi:hypothetical protein